MPGDVGALGVERKVSRFFGGMGRERMSRSRGLWWLTPFRI